jgi:hypothetical protein
MTRNQLIKIYLAVFSILLATIILLSPAYGADRLIIKDSFGIDTFTVTDTGKTTAIWEGTNTAGDGLTTLVNLSADNAAAGKISDVGFLLENTKIDFRWAFRTLEPSQGFSATKIGTGGVEFEIRNTSNSFSNVSLHLGNGAICNSSGQWLHASSREYKENIQNISAAEAFKAIEGLQPVKYNFKRDASKDPKVGFVAEEVPDLVATKDRKNLSPLEIVAVLTKVVQEQQKLISDQRKAFSDQNAVIAMLAEKIDELERR